MWAFAAHAEGRVFLIAPYDRDIYDAGCFWEAEWPALRDSGKVTEVIWINAQRSVWPLKEIPDLPSTL